MEKMIMVEIYENGWRHDVMVTTETLERMKKDASVKILCIYD